MPDIARVIKGIECCLTTPDICGGSACPYRGQGDVNEYCDEKLIKEILALLKEHEPIKPIEKRGCFYCGNCKNVMVGYESSHKNCIQRLEKYCRECGRKVKWSD